MKYCTSCCTLVSLKQGSDNYTLLVAASRSSSSLDKSLKTISRSDMMSLWSWTALLHSSCSRDMFLLTACCAYTNLLSSACVRFNCSCTYQPHNFMVAIKYTSISVKIRTIKMVPFCICRWRHSFPARNFPIL